MFIAALIAGSEKRKLGSEQDRSRTRRDIHAAMLTVNDRRWIYASIHNFEINCIHHMETGTRYFVPKILVSPPCKIWARRRLTSVVMKVSICR